MTDDIVARLRIWSENAKEQDATDIVVGLCEAADEIERLRAQVARLKDDLTAAYESHGNEVGSLSERLALAMEQRDEARRRICCDAVRTGGVYRRVGRETVQVTTPQGVADMMGWNCFKGTDNAQ